MRKPLKSLSTVTALGFLLAAVLLSAGGCTEPERRLTFWVGGAPQEVDYWETLVGEFEVRSGVEVEVIRQPAATDQRKQGLVIALASQRPDPDVFLMDIIWITQFVRSDWLEPLDAYFQEAPLHPRLFFQSVVDRVDRHEGRYFALPAFLDIGLLYYREDLLQRYGFSGPPATWDELVQQALKVQAAERRRNPNFNGFVWQGAQYEGLVCTFLEFITTHGGGMMTDGKVDLTRSGNLPALQFMQDLIRRWRISPPNTYTEMQEEEVRRSFQRGNALFERNWLYAWSLHQKAGSAVRGRIGLTALPHVPGARTAATLGGWHLGISKYSDAKDRAWRLATFLLSRETQKKLLTNLGWYSGRKDVYTDPEVRRNVANIEQLQQIVDRAVSRPDLAYYDHVSRIIQRYVNDCLSGKKQARQALADMQREIDQIEEFYGRP
jgi:multiple sugar transport system substrate-binding protein